MTAPTPAAAPGAPADGGTGGQAQPGTQQPQNDPSTGAQQQDQSADAQDVSQLPAWAQKLITDTRTEAAQHRTDKKTATRQAQAAQQQRNAVLQALGLQPDGTDAPPSDEEVQQRIEQAQAAAWATSIENQVLRIKGVDADGLLDSRAFVDSLDPFVDDDLSSPEFKTKLAAHVKEYVDRNPKYKTTPAGPARSGGEFPGGSGAGTPITEEQLSKMPPGEVAKAFSEGKLKHLM